MGQNEKVLKSLQKVSSEVGVGSGGTRNIAGNSYWHERLERELAHLH